MVWNFINLSICLWSRLLINFIKLHATKFDTISNKIRAAAKQYSNKGPLSNFVSLILSIKFNVLLSNILMFLFSMPKSNRPKFIKRNPLYTHDFHISICTWLSPKEVLHYFTTEVMMWSAVFSKTCTWICVHSIFEKCILILMVETNISIFGFYIKLNIFVLCT